MYWWALLLGPASYFTGFFFDDVTAEWANDLIASLLCWMQMAWCWFYQVVLDVLYQTVSVALPVMPDWLIDTAGLLNYFDAINFFVPLTEILILVAAWLPFYIVVRIIYIAQPWAG